MSRGLLTILAVLVCACFPHDLEVGEECKDDDWRCRSKFCENGKCRVSARLGEPCQRDQHCEEGNRCRSDKCVTAATAIEIDRALAQAEERKLLEESSVEPEVAKAEVEKLEAQLPPTGAGLPVRVARTRRVRKVFAACRRNERLVGGGCKGAKALLESFPSHSGEDDTVGARWNCTSETGAIEAYALCQRLPAEPAPAR
ncbi:MAG: hypothetical protein KJO07_05415 [Deltaproteobacteria bacterium]|nr:hypothetical protein [Deltaproteobacteria bacterium]